MNKKLLITLILALVCAIACACGLAACGGNDPKSMKSEEVTSEQWADAFKADNFKNVKIESSFTDEGPYEKEDGTQEDSKVTLKYTVIVADGIQYYKSEATVEKGPQELKDLAKDMTFEKYSSESDGKYTTYYKNKDGKWRQCPGEGGVADEVIERYTALGTLYNKFEYHLDGWVKGYWMPDGAFEYPDIWAKSLKFKNGKLAVVCTYEDDELTTLEYGGQTLTLPTPEDSSYAGTWKTYQLILSENAYYVGASITEYGGMTLTADFVKVEIKNDGTATSTNTATGSAVTVTGTWIETDDGILFMSQEMGRIEIELNGANLKVPVEEGLTIVLAKA